MKNSTQVREAEPAIYFTFRQFSFRGLNIVVQEQGDPAALPRLAGVGLDARMLLFAVTLALLTAVAFGVVPAMLMARGDMQRPLKESGRGGDGGSGRRRARSTLVVAEIGLAVMLVVGAALLARSFQRLVQQDPGFKATRAVTARVELRYSYSDFFRIVDFYDRLLTSLRAQPGVSVAGASNFLPLEAAWRGPFFDQGRPRPRSGDGSHCSTWPPSAAVRHVSIAVMTRHWRSRAKAPASSR